MRSIRAMLFGLTAVAGAAALAACGGGGSSGAPAVAPPPAAAAPSALPANRASAVVRLTVPARTPAAVRGRAYVSPQTGSLAMTVGNATTVYQVAATAPQCAATSPSPAPVASGAPASFTCTFAVTAPVSPSESFVFKTFASSDGSGAALSEGTVTQPIVSGTANTIMLTLTGDVASVNVVPVSASPIPACSPTTVPLTVTAKDAAGATIIAPGNYTNAIALTSTSATHSKLSVATLTAPGQPVSIAYDGKSPGHAIVAAAVSGATAGSYEFSPGPTVCAEYNVSGGANGAQGQSIGARQIARGPGDGTMWFTEYEASTVASVTTTTGAGGAAATPGTVTQSLIAPLANGGSGTSGRPNGIVTGPDGNMWLTDANDGILTFPPSANTGATLTSSTFYAPGGTEGGQDPRTIVAGPKGSTLLYFTQFGNQNVPSTVSVITTAGVQTDNVVPTAAPLTTPTPAAAGAPAPTPNPGAPAGAFGLAADGGGNLWFTEFTAGRIGEFTPMSATATTGTFRDFVLPDTTSNPAMIAYDGRGAMWFTEQHAGKIGRIDTATGAVTEYPLADAHASPVGIALGADGSMYFTEQLDRVLGRITPSGAILEFPRLTAGSIPYAIALGPDMNMWFDSNSSTASSNSAQVGYIGY